MPRDWSEERWIKVYLADSASWVSMTWQARGLYVLLQRVADRTGCIDLGPSGTRSIAALVRATWDDIAPVCDELLEAGYIVHRDGQLVLPEHIAQQEARTSDAARQRESRRKKRSHEASRDVTRRHTKSHAVTASHAPSQDVTTRGEESRSDQIEKKRAEQIARAREPAAAAPSSAQVEEVPSDPRIAMLAEKLRAAKRFSHLPSVQVAEGLVGKLGMSAFQLDEDKADEAIAAATLEAEDGANERRLRQLLGWKLVDALSGRQRAAKGHMVQDHGYATFEEFDAAIEADKKDAPWMTGKTDSTSSVF